MVGADLVMMDWHMAHFLADGNSLVQMLSAAVIGTP